MGNTTYKGLAPPDSPIFKEGLRIYGKPSLPPPETAPTRAAGDGLVSPPTPVTPGRLSGPPKREDFHSPVEFEEVRRRWQAYVDRLPGLNEKLEKILSEFPQSNRTGAARPTGPKKLTRKRRSGKSRKSNRV